MKKLLSQLSAKFLNGFFIMLPFLLTYLMVGQLFDMLMALTTPIADLLPNNLFSDVWSLRLTAAVSLILTFVIVGMVANTGPAHRLGSWFERTFLSPFPPYAVLKSLSKRIAGKDVPGQLQPALLAVTPETRMLVAIIEELPDGDLTVFVPLAPTPGVGMLQIVRRANVQKLDCSMTDALGWALNWGVGTEALFKGRKSPEQ